MMPARKIVEEDIGQIVPEGFLVSNEQLERIGGGDVKRGRRALRMMLADEREQKVHIGPVAKPSSVRIATEADEPACLDLLMADIKENALGVAPVDPARLLHHIRLGTLKKGGITAVIDGPNAKPVAIIILIPNQWAWSNSYYIQEVFNFVHPDHRHSHHADDLIDFAKWVSCSWTASFGYQVFVASMVMATRRAKDKIRLFRRRITQVGAAFIFPTPSTGGAP